MSKTRRMRFLNESTRLISNIINKHFFRSTLNILLRNNLPFAVINRVELVESFIIS